MGLVIMLMKLGLNPLIQHCMKYGGDSMPTIMCCGNVEMIQRINSAGQTLKSMWANRHHDTLTLYRLCSDEEFFNTWFYCLAGGEFRDLDNPQPTEKDVVQQVANNEGIGQRSGDDPRLEKLRALNKMTGITIHTNLPERKVVEFSRSPATQFDGKILKIGVNENYTKKGSGLSFEKGVVIQIGTPLSYVETEEKDVSRTGFQSLAEAPG